MSDNERVIVRNGRRVVEHIYFMVGDEPSDQDIPIGYIREPLIAQMMVQAFNAYGGLPPGEVFNRTREDTDT